MAVAKPNHHDVHMAAEEALDHAAVTLALVEGMLASVIEARVPEITLNREQARALQFAAMGARVAAQDVAALYDMDLPQRRRTA